MNQVRKGVVCLKSVAAAPSSFQRHFLVPVRAVTGGSQKFSPDKGESKLNKQLGDWLRSRMPKEEPHLASLKIQRSTKRKKQSEHIPHIVYFQVIGNCAPGGARSLLLYTESQRYLFNCSEGSQRLASEYCSSRTLAELGHILITRKSWENLGGMLGMCLSIRSTGAPDMTIHGPAGTMDVYEATKGFIILNDFDVLRHGVKESPYEDSGLKIKHVELNVDPGLSPVTPSKPKHSVWDPNHTVPMTASGESLRKNTLKKQLFSSDELDKPYDQSIMAYVVTCKSKPGKLMIDKCIKMGVPPGPLLGELKAGRNVILDNGVCVKSRDVMEQESLPLTYVIIEIPSIDYLNSLESQDQLSFAKDEDLKHTQVVFHFTKAEVFRSEGYLRWINSFPFHVQHVILNDTNVGFGSHDMLGFNHRLHCVNPTIFPELNPNRFVAPNIESSFQSLVNGRCVQAAVAQKIHVRPNTGVIEQYSSTADLESIDQELDSLPNAREEISKLHRTITSGKIASERDASCDGHYPRITFLGTGSSVPNKYRGVSSILVETCLDNFILLDCGEGAVLQMHRLFGREKAYGILRRMKAVYVSHLHADHHLGFINVVQHREEAFRQEGKAPDKLYLISPQRMAAYLFMYHCKFESILENVSHIRNEHLLRFSRDKVVKDDSPQSLYPKVMQELRQDCKLEGIVTCRAVHSPSSFCVSLTFGGFKLVYSGDTRPNDAFVVLGKGADLLIHEATMEHHMLADCQVKKHSTFTEAIKEGKKMEAKFTLLTHFSQRYSKLPVLDEIEGEENVGVAWDYMTVHPGNLHLIRPSYPALKAVFSDAMDLMLHRKEQKTSKDSVELIMDQILDDKVTHPRSKLRKKS